MLKNKIKIKKTIIYLGIFGTVLFFLLFIATCILIGHSTRENCNSAQSKYEGDCVEALIQVLEDQKNPYRLRNSAIWSLDQFGDSRALPALETFYTGNIPDRESLDAGISQYELKKAINLTRGGFNISSVIWRNKFIINNSNY